MKKFFYRVNKGDTVLKIASRFNLSPFAVISVNALKSEIAEGDVLFIERQDGRLYDVQPFDTIESVAEKFNLSVEDIKRANGVDYLFYGLKIIIPVS